MDNTDKIELISGNIINYDSGWTPYFKSLYGVESHERVIKFNSRVLPSKINEIVSFMINCSNHKEVKINFSVHTIDNKDEIVFHRIVDITMDRIV